jgi:hypothetical protein
MKAGTCPLCLTPLQRTQEGTLQEGMNEHLKVIHPEHWKRGCRFGTDLALRELR